MDNLQVHDERLQEAATEVAANDQGQPSSSGTTAESSSNTRTVLLTIEHQLDSASTFNLANLTAVDIDALGKELATHKDLRAARRKLAGAAKIRHHSMEIACTVEGSKVVLVLLAPKDKDPQVLLEQLMPLAREIEDEWHTRDERARVKALQPRPSDVDLRDGQPSTPTTMDGQPTGSEQAPESPEPGSDSVQSDRAEPPAPPPPGHVRVTYSAGGGPPRHPPLTLPPRQPRPLPRLTLGEERQITCEIYRRTAANRCLVKELETTKLQEATFSTSTELPTLINLLAGFPAVTLTVQDYVSDLEEASPRFSFHIVGLAALSDVWDQEVSLVDHLQVCVDQIADLLKKLKADKAKVLTKK